MSRRPSERPLRWVLATAIVVAGSGLPVRQGHAHAHDGPHDHHAHPDARDPGHDHGPAEDAAANIAGLLIAADGAFHWHDTFVPPFGRPGPMGDDVPGQLDGSGHRLDGDVLPGSSPPAWPQFLATSPPSTDRPPPPQPDLRASPGPRRPTSSRLRIGSVLIRC